MIGLRIICFWVANLRAILGGMINTSVPRSFGRAVIHFGLLPMGASLGPGRKAHDDDDDDIEELEEDDDEDEDDHNDDDDEMFNI